MAEQQPFRPGDRHAEDFRAWERQMERAPRPAERIPYGLACFVVVVCGGALLALRDVTLSVAVLFIAGVILALWLRSPGPGGRRRPPPARGRANRAW